jgi:hypothetical protein
VVHAARHDRVSEAVDIDAEDFVTVTFDAAEDGY